MPLDDVTTPPTPDLAEWLKLRIDEDEEAAQGGESWSAQPDDAFGMKRVTVDHSIDYVTANTLPRRADHMARWDPSRVLAEAAAKRQIVALHRIGLDPCDALLALAAPYQSDPTFREEWRP